MSITRKIYTAIKKLQQGELFSHIYDKVMLSLIRNKNVFSEYKKAQTYYKLGKKYSKFLKPDSSSVPTSAKEPIRVWTCWFQGEENAPELVKVCINRMRAVFGKENVTVITDENFSEFVTLPDCILKKYEKGIISRAHFSDILRIELLYQHGGLWLDSAVFCTCKNVPNYIADSELFAYKNINLTRNDINPIVASSWLLRAEKSEKIIGKTHELLFEYWKKEKTLANYYLVHIFFALATEVYPDEWKNVPSFPNTSPHVLQFEFFESYKQGRFSQIEGMSDFHKLNWKAKKPDGVQNTNYDYVLSL
ncbi:MAG: capsular polysaccharide synthesis protein [Treponema sp.]|nr:capsular polysaccharide synthesis protein [Treponema sp.]